jgi:hypothetical protein
MMQTDKKPIGIIDSLSGGFAIVARRPWVILIPILLDVFLWFGPKISAEPVFRQMIAVAILPPGVSEDVAQNWTEMKNAIQTGSVQFNVFSLVTSLSMGMPSLGGVESPDGAILPARGILATIEQPTTFFLLTIALVIAGVFLASIFLETIARGVRTNSDSLFSFVPRTLKGWANSLALVAAGMVAFAALLFPFAIVAALVSLFSQSLGAFVMMFAIVVMMWLALYLAFTVPAIFVSGVNLPKALLTSVTVFRFSARSALGLLFLSYLIQMGFSVIWEQLMVNAWGLAFDIMANAFLGSGLVAALMLFYRDRLEWLMQLQKQVQPTSLKG